MALKATIIDVSVDVTPEIFASFHWELTRDYSLKLILNYAKSNYALFFINLYE